MGRYTFHQPGDDRFADGAVYALCGGEGIRLPTTNAQVDNWLRKLQLHANSDKSIVLRVANSIDAVTPECVTARWKLFKVTA